jgi:ADP-ribose pyrophosphatase YjhB (NUDIX family)
MINFKTKDGIFNFRVAGILFNKDKILIHRSMNDDFYAFPGGRVEIFENTETTIVREMQEELGVRVKISRLLWICEQFFTHNHNKYHEICFYYLIECNDNSLLERGDLFCVTEDKNEFEFKWISVAAVKDEPLYPTFIKDRLRNLPITVESAVDFGE